MLGDIYLPIGTCWNGFGKEFNFELNLERQVTSYYVNIWGEWGAYTRMAYMTKNKFGEFQVDVFAFGCDDRRT